MSLDAATLKLLTAKDHFAEARWLSAGGFCYLTAASHGYELHAREGESSRLVASGVGSRLPYAGQLVADDLSYLGLDQTLHHPEAGAPANPLPHPATDLFRLERGFALVFGTPEEDSLCVWTEGEWQSLYRSRDYLRQITWHPEERYALALSWARDELPWFGAALLLIDTENPEASERLSPPGLDAPCFEAEFSPNGESLVASFQTGEFFQLWLYKCRTRNWIQLSFEEREHAVPLRRSGQRGFAFIKEGLLACLSSENAYWRLDTLDYSGHGHRIDMPLSYLSSLRASPRTGDLLMLGAALDRPLAPLVVEGRKGRFQSRVFGATLTPDKHLRAERVTWASVKGETIHGLLYRDASRPGPAPLILPIHGGPTDAVHATWPAKALAFVHQGYAVLYVNYRGSFGYGLSYQQALEGAFGTLEVNDLISGITSLQGSGWIDPTRVGLWGGGVASHTVLRALSLNPEYFAAGIAVFPIFDLHRHLALCSEVERRELIWALGSERKEVLDQLSAKAVLPSLQRPLALFGGMEDKLFDRQACEDLAKDLKERRVPLWLSLYEDEGRAFRKPESYSDYYGKVSGFFDRFLKFRS